MKDMYQNLSCQLWSALDGTPGYIPKRYVGRLSNEATMNKINNYLEGVFRNNEGVLGMYNECA